MIAYMKILFATSEEFIAPSVLNHIILAYYRDERTEVFSTPSPVQYFKMKIPSHPTSKKRLN